MGDAIVGKLVFQKTRSGPQRRVIFPTRRGESLPMPFASDQINPSLLDSEDEVISVSLELDQGKPVRIRAAGEAWTEPASPVQMRNAAPRQADPAAIGSRFHNPYNNIPALPAAAAGGLRQGPPVGHDRFHEDRWSGRIEISLEAVTPLLLLDTVNVDVDENKVDENSGHPTYDVRTGPDGKPEMVVTGLKGALRAAYEAITNSRLGVFKGHDDPLAYRMDARSGLGMVPARVGKDGKSLELWTGTSTLRSDGRPAPGEPMFAAWLPAYKGGRDRKVRGGIAYSDGTWPEHGDRVVAVLRRREKRRFDRRKNKDVHSFYYWCVTSIRRPTDTAFGTFEPRDTRYHKTETAPKIQVEGHVFVSNANIGTKHDERIFFLSKGVKPKIASLSGGFDDLARAYGALVRNYQSIHKEELRKRKNSGQAPDEYLGGKPGKTAWSRHVYSPEAATLKKGDLCYARLGNGKVIGLYPVMISRELSGAAPAKLLDDSLRPARSLAELSPADRVFGWVKQGGVGAYKGQLRIRKVSCETAKEDAIATFAEPLPLAILSSPKAQQARFYVGRSKTCPIAQNAGASKAAAGYDEEKGLRGRKAYPHHAHTLGLDGYWDGDAARRGAGDAQRAPERLGSYFREYARRAGEKGARDDQNRSIKGWVAPGACFSACIDVVNLSDAELGALLWLLDLNRGRDVGSGDGDARLRCLRVGGGKPLGFGSVKVAMTALDLETGDERKARYRELDPVPRAPKRDPWSTVEDFCAAVKEGYGEMADTTDFLKAFLRAAEGFDDNHPIHYPRTAPADRGGAGPVPPSASGENFKWFQENERLSEGNRGLALEDLASDSGLPYFEEREQRR